MPEIIMQEDSLTIIRDGDTITVSGGDMMEVVWGYAGFDVVAENITDQSRWSTWTNYILEYEGEYWEVEVEKGSTEFQDVEQPEELKLSRLEKVLKVDWVYVRPGTTDKWRLIFAKDQESGTAMSVYLDPEVLGA